jgi:hypothetical protein
VAHAPSGRLAERDSAGEQVVGTVAADGVYNRRSVGQLTRPIGITVNV